MTHAGRTTHAALALLVLLGGSALCAQQPTPADPLKPGPAAPLNLPQGDQPSVSTADIMTREVKTSSAKADSAALPLPTPSGRRSIGIALEGGGALGLAHIGVLKWMEEHHIPVDRIAGTSMGCLVSSLYASGKTPAEMETLTNSDIFSNVLTLRSSYADASFRRKQDQFELPQTVTLGLRKGVSLRNSLLADASLNSFLERELFSYNNDNLNFDRLPIPLRCVATDLNTMKPVIFEGGTLPVAVRASIAIPGVFAPVIYQGHYLVDGAIMDNLPTDIVKQDLLADVVIGIHLTAPAMAESDVKSIVGIFARAYSAGTEVNVRRGEALADVLVAVDTAKYTTQDYDKSKQLVALGYAAAEQHSKQLLPYALNDADWTAYLDARNGRKRPAPGTLQALRVEGKQHDLTAYIEHDLGSLKNKPMDPKQISDDLTRVQADGALETKFETYAPAATAPTGTATTTPAPQTPATTTADTGLLIKYRNISSGPPFLLIGPEITAATSNVAREEIDFRLIDQGLGGYGSELRSDVRVGYMTYLSSEYYRRLTASNWFVEPHLLYTRQPVYIWRNQKRIAEQFEQQAGGGVNFGKTFSNHLQARAEWNADVVRWALTIGTPTGPTVSGTAQTALIHLNYDGAASGTVSLQGLRIDVSGGSLFRAPNSPTAPLAKAAVTKTVTLHKANLFVFSADANTYFRRDVSQPLRFTLGGPFRLNASSIDEYRGTDTALYRAAYLRRLSSLPLGLGQGLYITSVYEAGEIWSPEARSIVRQDAVLGLAASTPLGALTFGTAIGDAGRRKVFFTFGRIY